MHTKRKSVWVISSHLPSQSIVKMFFNTSEKTSRAQHRSPIAVASEPIPCEQALAKAFWLLHPGDIDATSATPAHHWASRGLDPQRHEGPAPKTGHHDGSDMPSTARCPSTNPPPYLAFTISTPVLAVEVRFVKRSWDDWLRSVHPLTDHP